MHLPYLCPLLKIHCDFVLKFSTELTTKPLNTVKLRVHVSFPLSRLDAKQNYNTTGGSWQK